MYQRGKTNTEEKRAPKDRENPGGFMFSQRQEKKERAERKGNKEKEEKQGKPPEGDANVKQLLSHLNPGFFWLLCIPGASQSSPRPSGIPCLLCRTKR